MPFRPQILRSIPARWTADACQSRPTSMQPRHLRTTNDHRRHPRFCSELGCGRPAMRAATHVWGRIGGRNYSPPLMLKVGIPLLFALSTVIGGYLAFRTVAKLVAAFQDVNRQFVRFMGTLGPVVEAENRLGAQSATWESYCASPTSGSIFRSCRRFPFSRRCWTRRRPRLTRRWSWRCRCWPDRPGAACLRHRHHDRDGRVVRLSAMTGCDADGTR